MITFRDLALIDVAAAGLPARKTLIDERQTARMVMLMYRGLRPDRGNPLVWRKTDTAPAVDLRWFN